MSVLTEAEPVTYNCDGVNQDFTIPFTYLDDTYVWVRHKNGVTLDVTTLVITTDYTVALDTVTTLATYPTGDQITLSLLIPITQLVDLEKNGRLDNDLLDTVHDKLTLISQALKLDNDSIVGLEVPENPVPSMKLPDAATRASSYLAFDSSGNIIVVSAIETGTVTLTAYGEALINTADASAARALLDVYSIAIIDALAGVGRTTETIKDNQDDIVELAGAGRTTETVKDNQDDILNLGGTGRTDETVIANHAIVAGLIANNWTLLDVPISGTGVGLSRICFAESIGRFVSIGASASPNVAYSDDGETWSTASLVQESWSDVCWAVDLSLFVAVSSDATNTIAYSSDGTSWTVIGTGGATNGVLQGVCFSESLGLLVAIGSGATDNVAYSSNGTSWTTVTIADGDFKTVCFSESLGLFVAAGGAATNNIAYSDDGINWTTLSIQEDLYNICFSERLSIFVATGLTKVAYSSNGIDWTTITVSGANFTGEQIVYSESLSIFLTTSSGTPDKIAYSLDGINWKFGFIEDKNWNGGVAFSESLGKFVLCNGGTSENIAWTSSFGSI